MKRFKNILVVYNDSLGADDALTQAAALAEANAARLTLVDICPVGQRTEDHIGERDKRLARIARSLQGDGLGEADSRALIGTDADEVIREVLAGGHDIVIASSEGGSALQNIFQGALATSLMRKCPCPVWLVKPGQTKTVKRILAAIDLQTSGTEPDSTSVKIIEMARSLAIRKSAELHVMHAWGIDGKDADTLGSEVPDVTRERILEAHQTARRAALSALIDNHSPGVKAPVVHLPRGAFHREVANIVEAHDIDMVVMGTSRRSGLSALLMGGAAESILKATRCGVLTVKPGDYEASLRIRDGLHAA